VLQQAGADKQRGAEAKAKVVDRQNGQAGAGASAHVGDPKAASEAKESRPTEEEKDDAHMSVTRLRAKLNKPINLEHGIDANTPLKHALEFLSDRYEITILVDEAGFPSVDVVEGGKSTKLTIVEEHVRLPKMTGVSLDTVLRLLLSQLHATYLVRRDCLEVVPMDKSWAEGWTADARHLASVVSADFQNERLPKALQSLADQTGINVLVDAKIGDKANQVLVTAALSNVPVDTAVRLLADMGDFKAVTIDNVLYVTSKGNAAILLKEQEKR
jgi:hypothetical protein